MTKNAFLMILSSRASDEQAARDVANNLMNAYNRTLSLPGLVLVEDVLFSDAGDVEFKGSQLDVDDDTLQGVDIDEAAKALYEYEMVGDPTEDCFPKAYRAWDYLDFETKDPYRNRVRVVLNCLRIPEAVSVEAVDVPEPVTVSDAVKDLATTFIQGLTLSIQRGIDAGLKATDDVPAIIERDAVMPDDYDEDCTCPGCTDEREKRKAKESAKTEEERKTEAESKSITDEAYPFPSLTAPYEGCECAACAAARKLEREREENTAYPAKEDDYWAILTPEAYEDIAKRLGFKFCGRGTSCLRCREGIREWAKSRNFNLKRYLLDPSTGSTT